ncbi:MAG: DUF3048 domain-containing protein [Acidimicrobiia bacterium]|nr:DUF3048 domain-containing protein [Acidimicrobiia bacterium]
MNARRIAIAVAVAVVLLGGVVAVVATSGDGEEVAQEVAPTTTTEPPATTTTTEPPTFPLTSLPVSDPAAAERPALVVKIDNGSKARGRQAGLTAADLVYVEMVEGGATRLAAVYHSTDADPIGPVRSARTSDVALTANLNRPLFAYSGANQGVLDIVRSSNLVDAGFDVRPGSYQVRGSGVLRFFVATSTFFGAAPPEAGPPTPLFSYREAGAPVAAAGAEDAGGVRLGYGGLTNTQVSYEATPAGWARSQDGTPYVEESGARVEPANVVVQFTDYRSAGFVDVTGAASPEAVLVGEGEAWVLTGDKLIRGRWSRPDLGAGTAYTDSAGNLIELTPGRTWVELAPPGSAAPL